MPPGSIKNIYLLIHIQSKKTFILQRKPWLSEFPSGIENVLQITISISNLSSNAVVPDSCCWHLLLNQSTVIYGLWLLYRLYCKFSRLNVSRTSFALDPWYGAPQVNGKESCWWDKEITTGCAWSWCTTGWLSAPLFKPLIELSEWIMCNYTVQLTCFHPWLTITESSACKMLKYLYIAMRVHCFIGGQAFLITGIKQIMLFSVYCYIVWKFQ